MVALAELLQAVSAYDPGFDRDAVQRAYAFVQKKHSGQTRASGEPYVSHVTEVSLLATRLQLDTSSIVTALLHDTVEDSGVTLEQISEEFSPEVAFLVDGVTKLNKINFSSQAEKQAENFRKMLLAMAEDIRVLLIKLCDRTHNMRTLEYLSESRRLRIASETMEIYAPLAHRLGINWMKSELEDLSFRFLKPKIYSDIKESVATKRDEREHYIEKTTALISRELEQNDLNGEVTGRPKNFFSIYRKMELQGLVFEEIYDLIAFRIITDSLMDCYATLGVIHAAWKPIPGRFKDYIAMPKPNGYQSLHTTVIGPQGSRVEIQIRSQQMHDIAERGIAAHWAYKDSQADPSNIKDAARNSAQFAWLRDLVESESLHSDPVEFMSIVKEDLFPQEVFAFTPLGELLALSSGATPIDFAYHIHSEIGDHCAGARVNGQQVALDYQLQNGDTVEIITSRSQQPSKDWLNIVSSSKAKQRIRAWLKHQEQNKSVSVGKELLTRDLRKIKCSYSKLYKSGEVEAVAKSMGYNDVESMLSEIGYGKIATDDIIVRLYPDKKGLDEKLTGEETAIQKIFSKAARAFGDRASVKVNGINDVVFRFARCCDPLPGDDILGFVTRGRGVTIHRRDCSQAMSFDKRRIITVEWDGNVQSFRRIRLQVLSLDKIGILASMSHCISNGGANIVSAQVAASPDGKAVNTFEVKVENSTQLENIKKSLENLEGVIKVERHKIDKEEG